MSSSLVLRAHALVAGAILATMSGCYAEATTSGGFDVEYVAPPVVEVEAYPHVYYAGHVVYLIHDHWYYRNGPRWVYYRTEPRVLRERRRVIRRHAPAVHERARVRHAPPAHPSSRHHRHRHHRDDDHRDR